MTKPTNRRAGRVVVALVTVTSSLLMVHSGTAQAAPAPTARAMRHCTTPEINNGKVMREVQLRDRDFKVTHSVRRRIARGTEFSRTVTMGSTNQVTASISGTTTVKADAGAFFAKASAEASVTLAGNRQKTTTDSLEEKFTIHATKRDRLFVFYEGVATYRFRAHKRVCNRGGEKDYYGRLSSWDKTYESGNVLCPHSRYSAGTTRYKIAVAGGC